MRERRAQTAHVTTHDTTRSSTSDNTRITRDDTQQGVKEHADGTRNNTHTSERHATMTCATREKS
jgi:hypothetical protein